MFNSKQTAFTIKTLTHRTKNDPKHIKKRIKDKVDEIGLAPGDQAWIVLDFDRWPEEHLRELHAWAQASEQYGLALSNPNFEYWLLLHVADNVKGVTTQTNCLDRLRKCVPCYEKGNIHPEVFWAGVRKAVAQAKAKDTPPCEDWPRDLGSTVYRLVERILSLESGA